jgi:molecular chaperone HtpG
VLNPLYEEISAAEAKKTEIEAAQKDKKADELTEDEKAAKEAARTQLDELNNKKKAALESYAADNKMVRQLIDLALLANNMLKGEALARFVKRSVELM